MKVIQTLDELAEYDSSEAFPTFDWESRFDLLQRAVRRIARHSRLPFVLEDPSGFQDGPVFSCVQEFAPPPARSRFELLGGFYFSKFDSLFSGGRRSDKSSAPLREWQEMTAILATDYQLTYVDDELLAKPYNGMLKRFRCETWGERFFAAFYRGPTKQSTRRAKTHARDR